MPGPVFISHSSRDDAIVAAIRDALLACGVDVWDDARQLVAGDLLEPELLRVLDGSRALVAVLSPRTINSKWVTKEIRYALDLQKQRPEYKVIPVMVDGIESSGLDHWFPEEPLGLKLEVGPGDIQNALPALLDALGLSLPIDSGRGKKVEALPIAELTLELSDPFIDRSGGKHRAGATAELIYKPAEEGARDVQSRRFELVAPLGPIEAEDLRWYLER
ncbi:MAG TPA: toll/interleukin-1 receptor domain-containing protein, partial [Thermoanaerobaculia bacterium]